jgi:DNA relaxase NicK
MPVAKLKELGCDWLTVTSQDGTSELEMARLWKLILQEQQVNAHGIKADSWFGYVGWRIEHAFYGTRRNQICVIVSGPLAKSYARLFLEAGGRPSRIDLQATFETENISEQIEAHYEEGRQFQPRIGRPADVNTIRGRSGEYETLYLGRRASETFFRVYNKARESKDPYYARCLRLESEYKAKTAVAVSQYLLEEQWAPTAILGLLKGTLQKYGINSSLLDEADTKQPLVLRKTSTTESRMAWLSKQVSPTVLSLIEEVGYEQVIGALFPDGLKTHRVDGIIRASAQP